MPLLKQITHSSKPFWQEMALATLTNAIFPPRCVMCGVATEQAHTLCHTCFEQVHIITDPACSICGHPFTYEQGEKALCGSCLKALPPYDKAWSVFRYNEHTQKLITWFKYADRADLAPFAGDMLFKHGNHLCKDIDYLIPVPLHWRRMLTRRYNQSLLLTQQLAKHSQLPILPDGLKRIKHTAPQASLERKDRLKNVKTAFEVNPKHLYLIQNKNLLLIDDVMTTGATIDACCDILRKAGAKRINVLTLARRMLDE